MPSLFFRLIHRVRGNELRIGRRRALELLMASGVCAGTGFLPAEEPRQVSANERRRIVVIGGGFAGLACADDLHRRGHQVDVLEARGRVGGRVLTFRDFPKGKTVEGGGELIGANHPAWLAFAKRFKFKLAEVAENDELFQAVRIEGKLLDEQEIEKLYEECDEAQATLHKPARAIDPQRPWIADDARFLDRRTLADWMAELKLSDLAATAIKIQFEGDNAVANEHGGYLAMLASVAGGGFEKYWSETEAYRCEGGNQQLALALAKTLAERVHLSTKVKSIVPSGGKVVVEADDGRKWTADSVVLAVPPTVWSNIRIEPVLPAELSNIQMGPAAKYLAQVNRRFWLEKKQALDATTDEAISQFWESTDGQGNHGGAKVDEIATLCGFVGGPQAARALAGTDDDRRRRFRECTTNVYPDFALHRLDERVMAWPDDPLVRAGYSFAAPGQITRVGDLFERQHGAIFFAGEHTQYAFPGYMEGALQSGLAAAKRIVDS